jgi:hypothetical protein
MLYPLDEALDLPPGEVTASLAQRALRLATHMSFDPLQAELLAQHGVRITDSTLDSLMQRAGGVADRDRQTKTRQLMSAPAGVAREDQLKVEEIDPPQRLYVGCDGILYPTRYCEEDPDHPSCRRLVYQEMKTGCVFWQDRKGNWIKRVLGGREDPQQLGLSLWALAVRCGLLQAQEVVFISDGATWCQTIAELYFQKAIRILDWYHVSEWIWKTARALYPDDDKQTKAWASACLDILETSSGLCLLRHLQQSRTVRLGRGDTDLAALEELIGYVQPRVAMMDYVEYREAKYVIGSGMVEASCKQLVGVRLKGSGRQWSEPGAIAMTALKAHYLNGTWDQFWCSRPLQRAA